MRLAAERLSIRYGTHLAVREASLALAPGEITAIVGPSGCGKSSFLSALNRMTDLIPDAKVTGKILLEDEDIHAPAASPVLLRRRIGMIFQQPNPFPLSIRENVQLALREHGQRRADEREQTMQRALRDVGLWEEVEDRLGRSALRLSGGQQQRLCIARALALQPEILLLDEPCSALDPIAAAKVEDLIKQLRGRYTIAIVTHNLAQARRIADHVAVFWMKDGAGEIIASGPAESMFAGDTDPIAADYLSGGRG